MIIGATALAAALAARSGDGYGSLYDQRMQSPININNPLLANAKALASQH